jgi:hypothetical protein
MGKVLTHMTMSLDGYIADPDDQPRELFDWYQAGEVSVASASEDVAFDVDEASAEALRELIESAGALVSRWPRTTFVDGVEAAIAEARKIAGDKDVTIASANVTQQALDLALVDEVCVSLVPVLFGEGIPYFSELDRGHLLLEDPVVVQGRRALHLRYPVRR